MSDPLVIETAIKELTSQYPRQVKVLMGGPHGKDMSILLEGHDISHMVTSYDMTASPHDAIRVRLELVGVEMVSE